MINNICFNIRLKSILISAAIILFLLTRSYAVEAGELSQVPLEATTFAEPNIMLNLDDSLSMYNIITADGYDRNGTYNTWSINISGGFGPGSVFYPDNIPLKYISRGSCSSGWIQGSRNGVVRCIRVPDPISGGDAYVDTYYTKHYLDYLFSTYATSGSRNLTDGTIPTDYRFNVLRNTTKDLISRNLNGVRWCVSDLKQSSGSSIRAACGANQATLNSKIDAMASLDGGGTPLAETFYELTRYFRGVSYQGTNYTSPVQYRCQKNFAVVISDGYPTNDITNVNDIPRDKKSDFGLLPGGQKLPDWDGLHPTTTQANFDNNTIPQHSDGFGGPPYREGSVLYLDDLASYARDIDFFRSGSDVAGKPWGDATVDDNSDAHQNLHTYTIGFGINNQMLQDAAVYGGSSGQYQANNATDLDSAFKDILSGISDIVGSSASSTATTSFLSSGSQIYQVLYDTAKWSGSLISHQIESDPSSANFGKIKSTLWDTSDRFTSNTDQSAPDRNVLSVNDETGAAIALTWANLSEHQKGLLDDDSDKLGYLLGDQNNEQRYGGEYRDRLALLGDVVHSAPVYVKSQRFSYDDDSYTTFMNSPTIQNRTPIVYLGSNDGFIHGFNGSTGSEGGKEEIAFLPQASFSHLNMLTDPAYTHRYFVDGTPVVVDAQIQGATGMEWRTVLLGTHGAGAKGLFALDITDPSQFSDMENNAAEIFLWEITNEATITPLSGSASQSSNYSSGSIASKAIDGNTSGVFNSGSVTHTLYQAQPYLDLVLDENSYIDNIQLWNRTDCCSSRLSNFSIFISENPFPSTNLTTTQNDSNITEFYHSGIVGTPTNFEIGVTGKYVRVQLHSSNYLSIAEIVVNGRPADSLNTAFQDMGHLMDRPSIIRTKNNDGSANWFAITGNGVHSPAGSATFYAIDLSTGAEHHHVTLDASGENGIVSNTAVDLDGDDYVDRVYLTDVKGQVWRLNWDEVAGVFVSEYADENGEPLAFFQTTFTGGTTPQSLSSAVEVARFPGGGDGVMVLFGAGKYYETDDATVSSTEPKRSFYGVLDRGADYFSNFTTLGKSSLVQQNVNTNNANVLRNISAQSIDYTTQFGWFMDLPTNGERVVHEPTIFKNKISFTTLIPRVSSVVDPCVPQVSGWLMEVNIFDGDDPATATFDQNNDGNFNDADRISINGHSSFVSGIRPTVGAPLPPSIIRVEPSANIDQIGSGADGSDYLGKTGTYNRIIQDSDGNIQITTSAATVERGSWRSLN